MLIVTIKDWSKEIKSSFKVTSNKIKDYCKLIENEKSKNKE
jgi:hypothetical protein